MDAVVPFRNKKGLSTAIATGQSVQVTDYHPVPNRTYKGPLRSHPVLTQGGVLKVRSDEGPGLFSARISYKDGGLVVE